MAVLQVVGNRPGVGKTCLIGAVLSHLAATGRAEDWGRPMPAHQGETYDEHGWTIPFLTMTLSQLPSTRTAELPRQAHLRFDDQIHDCGRR